MVSLLLSSDLPPSRLPKSSFCHSWKMDKFRDKPKRKKSPKCVARIRAITRDSDFGEDECISGAHLRSRTRVPSEDKIFRQTANGSPEKCNKILLEYSILSLFFTKPHIKMKILLCKERQKCQEYSGVWNNLTCVTGICQVWHERRREELPLQVLLVVIIFLGCTCFWKLPGNTAMTHPQLYVSDSDVSNKYLPYFRLFNKV